MEPAYTISTNDELMAVLHPVPNFDTRDDIKPWLHDQLEPRGIVLVIERSDASKVVFKCKSIHRKPSAPRSSSTSSTSKLANGKTKRVRSQPEESCPFRLRVSYSVKQKNWSVTIIKHEHNFAICSNFGPHKATPTTTPTTTSSAYNRSTAKRSWASTYTPASTASPLMSIHDGHPQQTDTPLSTIMTPASELDTHEFSKKQRRVTLDSPLSHVMDPLYSLGLSQELKYHSSFDHNTINDSHSLLITNELNHHANSLTNTFDPEKLFEMDIESKMSTILHDDELFKRAYNDTSLTTSFQDHRITLSNPTTSTHADLLHSEADPDSLMYLLSTSNSNYSLEELECLDKAMSVDLSDKFLMTMFQ